MGLSSARMSLPAATTDAETSRRHAAARVGRAEPTSLTAVCALSFLCSIGTGIVWTGIPFIAKHQYGFGEGTTLWLYLTLGATYVVGALSAGVGLRRLEDRLSPRGVLGMILVLAALASAALILTSASWMLWAAAISINMLCSWLWPIVESYLTAGRHGAAMRDALGVWNLTWTSAVLVSLLLMAPLVEHHARMALVGTAGLYLLGLITLAWFGRAPGEHGDAGDDDEEGANRREYPHLLHCSRLLLLSSYVLNSAMSPLLPFLIARLGVSGMAETPLAATWTAARVVIIALMWRAGFWHGRWGTLLLGGVGMAIGFAMILAASSIMTLIVGLTLLGSGMAIVYYATLYYAMTVGRAEVAASGKFEALIGLGYTAGPAAGLIGLRFADEFRNTTLGAHAGVVIMVWSIMLVASMLALRPYRAARRLRTQREAANGEYSK